MYYLVSWMEIGKNGFEVRYDYVDDYLAKQLYNGIEYDIQEVTKKEYDEFMGF